MMTKPVGKVFPTEAMCGDAASCARTVQELSRVGGCVGCFGMGASVYLGCRVARAFRAGERGSHEADRGSGVRGAGVWNVVSACRRAGPSRRRRSRSSSRRRRRHPPSPMRATVGSISTAPAQVGLAIGRGRHVMPHRRKGMASLSRASSRARARNRARATRRARAPRATRRASTPRQGRAQGGQERKGEQERQGGKDAKTGKSAELGKHAKAEKVSPLEQSFPGRMRATGPNARRRRRNSRRRRCGCATP